MEIQLVRVDGALKINPAPPYITNYLQYTHRSFAQVNWKMVNKFEKRLLYSQQQDGSIITFQGFFDKIYSLIVKNDDKPVIEDNRTPVGEPDLQAVKDINWEGIGSTGLREYQIDPVVEFLYKAKDGCGVVCATGG